MRRAWNDRIRQRRSFFLRRVRAIKVGCATRDSLAEFHIHGAFHIQRSCERRVATVGCNRDSKARYVVLTSQVADMAWSRSASASAKVLHLIFCSHRHHSANSTTPITTKAVIPIPQHLLGQSIPSSASTIQHTAMITRDVTVIIDGPSSSSTARYSKVANFQFQLRLSQQDSNQFARWAHQKWAANRGSTGMNSSASRSAAECLFTFRTWCDV